MSEGEKVEKKVNGRRPSAAVKAQGGGTFSVRVGLSVRAILVAEGRRRRMSLRAVVEEAVARYCGGGRE